MKQKYQSRTLWVNGIVAGLVALEASSGMLQPLLPANFYVMVSVGLPVVNAILRIVTTKELA